VSQYFDLLGPLGYPLMVCSVGAVALIVERALFFARLRPPGETRLTAATPPALQPGFELLSKNAARPRADRDEVIALWLADYARPVRANLGWLGLIASIAPMLGLLGTVFGMTRAFEAIAAHDGPLSPAVLADGIWEAMLTTLVGLTVAVPTLVAVWGFRALASRHLEAVTAILNRASLALDGIVPTGPEQPLKPLEAPAPDGASAASPTTS